MAKLLFILEAVQVKETVEIDDDELDYLDTDEKRQFYIESEWKKWAEKHIKPKWSQ